MRATLVKISRKLGLYKKAVEIDTYFVMKKKVCAFRQYGIETLRRGDEAVSSFGGHLIPYFGTLLGVIREHGFIPHDNDIDMALPIEERPDNIVELMGKYGFEHERQDYIKATGRIILDQFSYKGCHMDVFYLFDDRPDGKVYSYVSRRHETKDWREANATDGFPCVVWPTEKCNYARQEFLGLQIYVPEKAHEWMRDIFGPTYMTPIKNWTPGEKHNNMERPAVRTYRR